MAKEWGATQEIPTIEVKCYVLGDKKEALIALAMRDRLYERLRLYAERVSTKLRATVRTWEHDKPDFPRRGGFRIKTTGKDVSIAITPIGNQKGIDKWVSLDWGTTERYAKLSKNWKSKTQVGEFSSGPGRGRVILLGRAAFERKGFMPEPGILSRGWTDKIIEDAEGLGDESLLYVVEKAISDEMRKAGW